MRIVLDTNIIISALFWNGRPRRLFQDCQRGRHKLVTSPAIISETEKVLRHKFRFPAKKRFQFIRGLLRMAEIVFPDGTIHVVTSDPADDRILETAFLGEADMIITGDKHLLTLKHYQGISIRTAAEALDARDQNEEE